MLNQSDNGALGRAFYGLDSGLTSATAPVEYFAMLRRELHGTDADFAAIAAAMRRPIEGRFAAIRTLPKGSPREEIGAAFRAAVAAIEPDAAYAPGWHGDVGLVREFPPISGVIGTAVARPEETREEAEAAAPTILRGLLATGVLPVRERAPRKGHTTSRRQAKSTAKLQKRARPVARKYG